MRKILTLVIASIFVVTIASAQTNWVDHKGDERISLKFPAEPKEVVPGSFACSDGDSTVYVFTLVDFVKVEGVDSVQLAPLKDTPEFAGNIKTGVSRSLPNVTFEDFRISKWKGFTCYSTIGADPSKRIYDMWMVLIGNKMYSFSTIRKNGIGVGNRDIFLNSVRLNN